MPVVNVHGEGDGVAVKLPQAFVERMKTHDDERMQRYLHGETLDVPFEQLVFADGRRRMS